MAIAPPRAAHALPRNRVLLALTLAALAAGLGLAFLTVAPNRLLSGVPVSLPATATGWRLCALPPAIFLLAAPFLPPRRITNAAIAAMAAILLVALVWLAGAGAASLAAAAPHAARVSLGAGFWTLFVCGALALADALRRLALPAVARQLAMLAPIAAIGLVAASGALDHLALVEEYGQRREIFAAAALRHVALVATALLPTLLVGMPLGLLAQRRARFAAALFPVLNLVQTIPAIALFGLLIAPLSALGIGGIGLPPAIIALFLYALLPIVRNTAAGLAGVPEATLDAARGVGMTAAQIFRRVELPLALPVLLSGLRIAAVQAIGLAVLAALIGAGGLGALLFEGLATDALDLVLLGALPVIALALAVDAGFGLVIDRTRRVPA